MAKEYEGQLLKLKKKDIKQRPRFILKFLLAFATTMFLLHNTSQILKLVKISEIKDSNLDRQQIVKRLLPAIPLIPAQLVGLFFIKPLMKVDDRKWIQSITAITCKIICGGYLLALLFSIGEVAWKHPLKISGHFQTQLRECGHCHAYTYFILVYCIFRHLEIAEQDEEIEELTAVPKDTKKPKVESKASEKLQIDKNMPNFQVIRQIAKHLFAKFDGEKEGGLNKQETYQLIKEATQLYSDNTGKPLKEVGCLEFDQIFACFMEDGKIDQREITDFLQSHLLANEYDGNIGFVTIEHIESNLDIGIPEAVRDPTQDPSLKFSVEISQAVNQAPLKVSKNDKFMVWAHENPTTGFKWSYIIDIFNNCGPDGCIFSMTNSEYVKDQAPGNMMGVGGKRYFTFTVEDSAVVGSEVYIGFIYCQPWNMPKNWQKEPQHSLKFQIV